jgi:hypothetical protein
VAETRLLRLGELSFRACEGYYSKSARACTWPCSITRDRVLIRDKVAGFIVIGGQDNVQALAGQMLGFFAELGFLFPQFPYVAHSRLLSSEHTLERVPRGGRKAHALGAPEPPAPGPEPA